ncbi:MAG: hypothetical protein WBM32_05725 [Crocosphaera sp.]
MKLKKFFRRVKMIVLGWDFLVSLAISLISYFAINVSISNLFAKDIYGIGISVLSIVFSVYFAALAIIIASSDDGFVDFLEKQGVYQEIIWTFRYSLFILFIGLLFSLIIYALTSAWITFSDAARQNSLQPREYFAVFIFLFSYGLFCSLNSTLDSIKYALRRSRYLQIKRNNDEN